MPFNGRFFWLIILVWIFSLLIWRMKNFWNEKKVDFKLISDGTLKKIFGIFRKVNHFQIPKLFWKRNDFLHFKNSEVKKGFFALFWIFRFKMVLEKNHQLFIKKRKEFFSSLNSPWSSYRFSFEKISEQNEAKYVFQKVLV